MCMLIFIDSDSAKNTLIVYNIYVCMYVEVFRRKFALNMFCVAAFKKDPVISLSSQFSSLHNRTHVFFLQHVLNVCSFTKWCASQFDVKAILFILLSRSYILLNISAQHIEIAEFEYYTFLISIVLGRSKLVIII